jgi:hypothetical protein
MSKRYRYQSLVDPDDPNRDLYATGLEGVPIQVWTTKAFSAQWTAPIDPARPPIVAELTERAGEKVLVGTITSNLPVQDFTDPPPALFWRGKVYELSDLPTGVAKPVSFAADAGAPDMKAWLDKANREWAPARQNLYPTYGEPGTTGNPKFPLWPVLFAEAVTDNASRTEARNASLRRLDQSWRVAADRPEQAVLVLRVGTEESVRQGISAEDMTRDPRSPSRLWLGELPTSGKPRPAVQGTLKQETYIRVFIPVKTAPKKQGPGR